MQGNKFKEPKMIRDGISYLYEKKQNTRYFHKVPCHQWKKREVLGTGGNIDIGDDLFIWHKKYIKK